MSRRSSATATANGSSSTDSLRSTLTRGAVGAVVGGAAMGVASRLANRGSGHKVLGTRIPIEINPRRLDASKLVKNIDTKRIASHVDVGRMSKEVGRLGKDVDVKNVLRRIGNLAEQVEARSEDVRNLSAQAKRLTRRLG